jgi:hypothetical protein
MNAPLKMLSLFGFALLACVQASADEPTVTPRPLQDFLPFEEAAAKEPAKQPEKKVPPKTDPDPLAAPVPARGERALGYNPQMVGDLPGVNALLRITVIGTETTTTLTTTTPIRTFNIKTVIGGTPTIVISPGHGLVNGQTVTIAGVMGLPQANGTFTVTVIDKDRFALNKALSAGAFGNGGKGVVRLPPVTASLTTSALTAQTRLVLVPVAAGGAFKVAENASPMPVDRVFMTYNYFGALHGPPLPNSPLTSTQINVVNGRTITTTTFTPSAPPVTANLHREVFGFEKTFFDGFASIELRVPIAQQTSSFDAFDSRFAADLTIIGKYAFLLDRERGDVLSGGLAVTAPTGPRIDTVYGPIHSTYLQPWMGYVRNFDRFYIQGFHSVVVPTDSRDVTLLFNDVGINFWLYRGNPNGMISSLVPTLEVHVTTPLNHRSLDSAIQVPDIVSLTGGVHLGLFRNSSLSLGMVAPISGPRPFNIEGFAQFNWRF